MLLLCEYLFILNLCISCGNYLILSININRCEIILLEIELDNKYGSAVLKIYDWG